MIAVAAGDTTVVVVRMGTTFGFEGDDDGEDNVDVGGEEDGGDEDRGGNNSTEGRVENEDDEVDKVIGRGEDRGDESGEANEGNPC